MPVEPSESALANRLARAPRVRTSVNSGRGAGDDVRDRPRYDVGSKTNRAVQALTCATIRAMT